MPQASPKDDYLAEWTRLFAALLGWTPQQVVQWAERHYGGQMDDANSIFYHELPIFWAVPEFIPATLKTRISSRELLQLEHELLAAFWDEHHHVFPNDIDFNHYRAGIESVLLKYGESLESLTLT